MPNKQKNITLIPKADKSLSNKNIREEQINYWKQKLKSVSALQLPTDYQRPAVQKVHEAAREFTLSKDTSDQLQAACHREDVTLFMMLLAISKVLFYRYSGQEDICVGSLNTTRTYQKYQDQIGFLVNKLALRTEVSGEDSFIHLLQKVKATILEAYNHQDVPFEKVVKAIVHEKDLSRSPLFQMMLILKPTTEIPKLKLGDHILLKQQVEKKTEKLDLTFTFIETKDGMQGTVSYCADLYKEETIARMIDHYKELLESVIKFPGEKIGRLVMLTPKEEYQLLVEFNDTRVAYPKDKSIIDLVEEQAARIPDNVALVFEDEKVTYGELNKRANQLANFLRSKGIKEETLVPICIERGVEMLVGILGILKAGGAYVPIDPVYPEDRIRYMLEDTAAGLVVSSTNSRKKLKELTGVEIIELDGNWIEINNAPGTNLKIKIPPDQLAYVIYTSGSTGKPKGVMIEHGSVYCFICWCAQEFSSDAFEIAYAATSMCFDLSVFEFFYPLSIGRPIRLLENGLQISKYLAGDKAVMTNSVPVVIENLLKEEIDISHITTINMAGEPVPANVHKELDYENRNIRNLYGPTEDTTYSTVYHLSKNKPVLIGKPISNSSVRILSKDGSLVPIGVIGEIYLTGAGLARGYLNREALTAERFVPDTFNPKAKMYKTGDLGRWLEDGNIEYLGRIDNQVKVRGFRIELGEIEAVLLQSGLVRQAVVQARADHEGNKLLVGYVTAKESFHKEEIISYLHSKLPDYMVPAIWIELENLPLTPNGKIDKKALPDPDISSLLKDQYVSPENETEVKMVKIWKKLLHVDRIGIHDTFFELGGNSIQAVTLFTQIEKKFGKSFPLATIFRAPDIKSLAEIIRNKEEDISWSSLVPIQPNGSNPPLFCIHAGAGNVLFYHGLAKHLGNNQPLYGLQARGINGKEPFDTSIEDMAAHYIADIRLVQPEGPYYLAGYCLGGTIAFEMAQQLKAQGYEIKLLALLNSLCPAYKWPTITPDRNENTKQTHENKNAVPSKLSRYMKEFAHLNSRGKLIYPLKILKKVYRKTKGKLTTGRLLRKALIAGYNFYNSRSLRAPKIIAHNYLLFTNSIIEKKYKPKIYPGKVIIFRSPKIYKDPSLGWGEFISGGVKSYDVPGEHKLRNEILKEPFVPFVAAKLTECLM